MRKKERDRDFKKIHNHHDYRRVIEVILRQYITNPLQQLKPPSEIEEQAGVDQMNALSTLSQRTELNTFIWSGAGLGLAAEICIQQRRFYRTYGESSLGL